MMTTSDPAGQHPLPAPLLSRPTEADVLLADGSVATVRELRPEDRAGLTALHETASEQSLRLRFFTSGRHASKDYLHHLFEPVDSSTVAALVVTRQDHVLALATAELVGPDAAEVAFLVDESLHGQGLGSLLLEHLAAACREHGVRRFVAEVLTENHAMLQVFLDAGFEVSHQVDQGTVHVEMGTAASARAIAAADARESHAEARSLAPLLYPRSVAVTGVRRDGTGIGAAVLASIRAGDFTGALSVVHPAATVGETLAEVRVYPRFVDVRDRVDLAVVAVPAERVLDSLRDAAAAGVPAVVVISSGFEELGAAGAALQRDMLRLARDHSMRLVGPNCLGLMSNSPDIRLNATFSRGVPPPGGLAIASQSGGVGIALIDLAQDLGVGVASFVSLGNKADVSGNDLLAAWYEDPQVSAAALYLESFGNAAKFARVARRFAERKPLLAVVGGRSAGGRRAGASHTAAAAASGVGVDALFAQAGVIGCRSAEEMAETALVLAEQPLPAGPRIAVLSNAGGMGVLAADEADQCGLVVPELSAPVREVLAGHVLGTTGTSNPIDAGAGAAPADLAAITSALLASDEVDAVVVVLVRTSVTDPAPAIRALAESRAAHPGKPMLLVPMGGLDPQPDDIPGITRYRSVSTAISALARVVRYAAWLRVPHEDPEATDPARAGAARLTGDRLVAEAAATHGWLSADQAAALLSPYGLGLAGELVHDAATAARAASDLGFPVALKVADPGIVHKTDRGLVRVGLSSAAEVLAAAGAFAVELDRRDVPMLVQPVVSGVELALGVVRDPGFGPLVMVAAGGVATDLWADRTFLIPPLSRGDAARALRSLRTWPLLNGFRGAAPVDLAGVERLIVALGALATEVPQVSELDLNPVVVTPESCVLIDVKVRLAEAPPINPGVPRQLRRTP